MHIPDGILDPRVALAAGAASAAGVGAALYFSGERLRERTAPLMGVMAAFVFAAQMVNFPLPGLMVSGHLIGGVLAAIMLGPWAGVLVLAVVLVVQALLFADGGITALGANIFNMGLVGSLVGWCAYAPIRKVIGGPAGVVAAGVVAAWVSVTASAFACSLELAASQPIPLPTVFNILMWYHILIGVGEAIITGMVLCTVVAIRPDLVDRPKRRDRPVIAGRPDAPAAPTPAAEPPAKVGAAFVAGFAVVALLIAAYLSPFASKYKDGLDAAAEELKLPEGESVWTRAPLPDYDLPKPEGASEEPDDAPPPRPLVWTTTSTAGVVGTLVVLAAAWLLAASVKRRPADAPAAA